MQLCLGKADEALSDWPKQIRLADLIRYPSTDGDPIRTAAGAADAWMDPGSGSGVTGCGDGVGIEAKVDRYILALLSLALGHSLKTFFCCL